MKFAHVRGANISHLRSKYFTAKRFHLPARANFVAYLLYGRYAVWEAFFVNQDTFDESETYAAGDDEIETEIDSEISEETLTLESGTSARERVVFIEIVDSNEEKWVFSCDREEYEWLYYKLEELLSVYEVK